MFLPSTVLSSTFNPRLVNGGVLWWCSKVVVFYCSLGGGLPFDYIMCLKWVGTIYSVIVCSKICLCIAALVAVAVLAHPFRVWRSVRMKFSMFFLWLEVLCKQIKFEWHIIMHSLKLRVPFSWHNHAYLRVRFGWIQRVKACCGSFMGIMNCLCILWLLPPPNKDTGWNGSAHHLVENHQDDGFNTAIVGGRGWTTTQLCIWGL